MKGDKRLATEGWFKKAENDLKNAENTIKMESPPCDTICFHSQQCAEKYLKGLLTFHEIDFPKTHSLEALVEKCLLIDPKFGDGLDDIEVLSSYGVEVRYPEEIYEKGSDLRFTVNSSTNI